MNILIVNRALGTLFGGGESFDLNAARYLRQRGHEVTMVTGRPMLSAPSNIFADIDVVYLPSPAIRKFAYATERLHSKLSAAFYHLDNLLFEHAVYRWFAHQPKDKFDIVHCCSLFNLPHRLLTHYRQPVVSWLPGPPSGRVRRCLPNLLLNPKFGLFTHGSSEWTLKNMGYTREREYTIIEPGVELALAYSANINRGTLREEVGLGLHDLVGVTTARLIPIKNHAMLFKAIALAKTKGVIWHWLVIGNGLLEQELKTQVRHLGIEAQIKFLGYQEQVNVHKWLAIGDLFVLTSKYENFSIAALEAMAHRLPIIGTQVGYLQHLIKDSGAGLLVPSDESVALAQALVQMADSKMRNQYSINGREFVERLDWPQIAEKLERLYRKVSKEKIS